MFAKAPTIAWLLTALSCFVIGMAVVEAGHQAAALPSPQDDRAPVEVVVTVEVAYQTPPSAAPTAEPPAPTVSVPFPTPPTLGARSTPTPTAAAPIACPMTEVCVPPASAPRIEGTGHVR
jgi:hypothetical protein